MGEYINCGNQPQSNQHPDTFTGSIILKMHATSDVHSFVAPSVGVYWERPSLSPLLTLSLNISLLPFTVQ